MDKNSLAHTKWNCKYHIVFAHLSIEGKLYMDKLKKISELF